MRKKHDDSINPEIKRLYVEVGYSLHRISKMLGIHPEVIKRKLLSMGIPVRNLSEAAVQRWRTGLYSGGRENNGETNRV